MSEIKKEIYKLEKFTIIFSGLYSIVFIVGLLIFDLNRDFLLLSLIGIIIFATLLSYRIYFLKYEKKEVFLRTKLMKVAYISFLLIAVILLIYKIL